MSDPPPPPSRPLVRAAHFRSFRRLEELTVPFPSRLTVLVGQNGIGKSSVLDGLHLLSQVVDRPNGNHTSRATKLLGGAQAAQRLRTAGASGTHIELGATLGAGIVTFTIDTSNADHPYSLVLDGPRGRIASEPGRSLEADVAGLPSCVRVRFDARRAVRSSDLHDSARFEYDGAGLPGALQWIASNAPELRDRIEEDLRSVVAGVTGVFMPTRTETVEDDAYIEVDGTLTLRTVRREAKRVLLQVGFERYGKVDGDLVSEGTILALALLTLLHAPDPPRLILIDDLELGLHPDAQRQLVSILKRVVASKPDLQVIGTTHSPYLVDQIDADSVIVMGLDAAGYVKAAPLASHPDYPKWKGTLEPGELWPYFGEDWLARPSHPQADDD